MSKKGIFSFEKGQWLEILRVTLVMLAVAAVVALMLSFVNEVTAPRIQAQKEETFRTAMQQVLPAEEYQAVSELDEIELDATVSQIHAAKNGDAVVGYCVSVAPLGFGGAIEMVVGVDLNGNVSNVNIVSMSETPGLGTKAKDPGFLNQYVGLTDGLTVKTNGAAGENQVNAVTGATVSSKAVTAGVQAAINAVQQIKGGMNNG